jgi:hypothetical protein
MPKAFGAVKGLALGGLLGLLLAGVAGAATLFVDPAGDDAGDCLSPATACATIQSAVDRSAPGDTVQLAPGTYAQRVLIDDRERLRVAGGPGVVLVPPAGEGEGHVISVNLSRQVELRDLTLTGNGTVDGVGGVAINLSRGVEVESCVVQDFGGGGIAVFRDSSVNLRTGKILRNRFHGLRVDRSSDAVVTGSPLAAGTAIVEDNQFAGVIVNGGGVSFRGSVLVTGNQIGILGEGAQVSTCCGEDFLTVTGNVVGISLRGGHLELRGPALIEANQTGVRLVGTAGIFGRFSSERVVVRQNGVAGSPTAAGIFLTASQLDLFTSDVVDNLSRGVLLQDNSSLRLADAVVAGNGAEGVRVEALSSARLFAPSTLQGNGGLDLSCAPDSFAAGDDSAVERAVCPGFGRSPRPSPGPR